MLHNKWIINSNHHRKPVGIGPIPLSTTGWKGRYLVRQIQRATHLQGTDSLTALILSKTSLLLLVCLLLKLTIIVKSMSLRQKLLNGGKSYGPMLMMDSPIVAEILASVPGYTHLIVDHEHSPTDVRSGQRMLQAIQAANAVSDQRIETIVRVPGPNDPIYLKKVLDSLTMPGGILVPMVDDAPTAKAIVSACHYPKQQSEDWSSSINGSRGFAGMAVRGSAFGNNQNYMQSCREDLLIMVQVENRHAVAAISAIAETGVDAIFIGPYDLSTSIGKAGQFEDPEVSDLIAQAEESVRASGCLLAGFRSAGRSLKEMFLSSGYSLVCGGLDVGLLRRAATLDAKSVATFLDS